MKILLRSEKIMYDRKFLRLIYFCEKIHFLITCVELLKKSNETMKILIKCEKNILCLKMLQNNLAHSFLIKLCVP